MKKMERVVTMGVNVLVVIFCVYFYANAPIYPVINMLKGKVSQEEIMDGYYMNYVGRIGAEDVPILTSSDVTFEKNTDEEIDIFNLDIKPSEINVFVVETDEILSLDYYLIKDNEWLTSDRRGYNGRAIGVTSRPAETTQPNFYESDLYLGYYLVELDDGTYILTLMDQGYKNASTLPIAHPELLENKWEERLMTFADENNIDKSLINTDYMLNIHAEGGVVLEVFVRIIVTGVFVLLLMFCIGFIDLKKKGDGNGKNFGIRSR